MSTVKPDNEVLAEASGREVPEPWVNPTGPYSKFQAVSVPPAVQERSAEEVVKLEAASEVGAGHAGVSLTKKSSTPKSFW